MQIESDLPPPSIDRSVRAIVSELVGSTRRPQRELLARTGLSKDQLSRALRGARQMELAEAVAILGAAVRSGWDSMRQCLNIPDGWGPKLIRHSMSSELRKRRVDPWELSGQLGHRVLKTSETYAIYDPDYLGTVQMGIKDLLADLEKACGSSIHPTFTQLSRANAPR